MEYGTCSDCEYALIRSTAKETTVFCGSAGSNINIRETYLKCSDQKPYPKPISAPSTSKSAKKTSKKANPRKGR